MAELDKGGAGQDKIFWKDVALEFNYCSEDKGEYGELVLTSAADKKFLQRKMMTLQSK
jgi:hypothetical protein